MINLRLEITLHHQSSKRQVKCCYQHQFAQTMASKIDTGRLSLLFRPGSGSMPPYLAGRDHSITGLEQLLSNLKAGIEPPTEAILYGPRGNGKTVLLRAIETKANQSGIQTIALHPTAALTSRELAAQLLDHESVGQLSDKIKPDSIRIDLPGVDLNWRKMSLAERDDYRLRHLRPLLAARCFKQPLIVTVDEAHKLNIEVGRTLLDLSLFMRSRYQAPFLLILAGTPNLEQRLHEMDATFWARSYIDGIGRLTLKATREALHRPLLEQGVTIDDNALTAVVEQSQHYPYFVQSWGQALCLAMLEAGHFEVSRQIVEAARPAFDETRTKYYAQRYRELQDKNLLPAAALIAKEFQCAEPVEDSLLQKQLCEGLRIDQIGAKQLIQQLSDLGYQWRQPKSLLWEPGIPSLMNFVQSNYST